MDKKFQERVEELQKSFKKDSDKEIIWSSLVLMKLYENTEDALCEINFFRKYKDIACQMSDDECLDVYKGVILLFGRQQHKPLFIKHLFEDLFDWHRLDFANKRIAYILKNAEGEYRSRVVDFLYADNYFLMGHDYRILKEQGLV